MQLSLNLDDQEEEPPQGAQPHFSFVQSAGKPQLTTDFGMPARHRVLKMSAWCREFRNVYFPEATDLQWSDWRWQIQNRIRDLETVQRMIRLTTEEEKALELAGKLLPMAVTPHYMALVSPTDPDQAIRR